MVEGLTMSIDVLSLVTSSTIRFFDVSVLFSSYCAWMSPFYIYLIHVCSYVWVEGNETLFLTDFFLRALNSISSVLSSWCCSLTTSSL